MSSEADKAGDLYTLDASSIYPFIAGIEKHIQPIVRKLRYFDFQKLFSKDNRQRCTCVIKHHINTRGKGPIRLRPKGRLRSTRVKLSITIFIRYRYYRYQRILCFFLVVSSRNCLKKYGTLILCIDFRRLNAITIKAFFTLLRIDDTLKKLSDTKYFTT